MASKGDGLSKKAFREARDTGELILSGRGLAKIPGRVFELTNLNTLDLRGNELTSLPREIGELTGLRYLYLSSNRLTRVPPQIGALAQLISLDLNHNQLRGLPDELAELKHLGSLMLAGNQLAELPPVVCRLRRLEALWLNENQLAELPEEIGALRHLHRLRLGRNRLATLPGAIGRLVNLNTLELKDNELTELPPELGHLGNLHLLDLARNRLSVFPRELADLADLRQLRLDDNAIAELPPEIGQLVSLSELNLARNRLTGVPAEIAGLDALKDLRLDGNQLVGLPSAFAKPLDNGLILDLRDNPLGTPLPALGERGPAALAAYLRGLERAAEQFEAKVLLLGEGNVGKTSLGAALRGQPFVERRPSTPGIEITALALPHPERPGVQMQLRLWDFGGQEDYRITHQLFISQRALYVVVWYPREGWTQGNAETWLRGIMLRTGRPGGDGGEGAGGRVLIVATHSEDSRSSVDFPRLDQEFPGMLVGHFEVDNRTGAGLPKLRAAIAREAARLPQMGMAIGVEWAAARAELLELAATKAHVSFAEFVGICERNEVPQAEAATLAGLMHDLGQVVYYGDDFALRDIVVLSPEWLTRMVSAVLNDVPTRQAGGVLDHARLAEVWQDQPGLPGYLPHQYPFFLRLLEKFDLSYRLDDGHSLIAQLVPPARPGLPWDFRTPPAPGTRSLVLRCRLSEPAPGLIAWLTVRWHRAATGRHWRNGVFLRYQPDDYDSEALIELRGERELTMEVRAPAPDFFFNVLIDSLHYLFAQRWPALEADLLVPCPTRKADGTPCDGEYRLEFLRLRRRQGRAMAGCQVCLQDNDVERLLTGFPRPQPLSADLERTLEDMNAMLALTGEEVKRIGELWAVAAKSVRLLLTAAQQEVDDCPRLFTLTPEKKGRKKVGLLERHYRLVLWCEYPHGPHPLTDRFYSVGQPREWFAAVRPYAALVLATIEIVLPAAGVGRAFLTSQQLNQVQQDLGVMRDLVRDSGWRSSRRGGEAGPDDVAGGPPPPQGSPFTVAEGEALRALRAVIFAHDPQRHLAGLRRWLMPSGEYRWLCPHHYAEYNPGLPRLPPVPPARELPQGDG